MRKKKLFVAISLILLVAALSGCTGAIAWPGLSATAEVAYLAHTNAVYAIDIKTHNELWKFSGAKAGFTLFNTNPSMFIAAPVTTSDGLVVILDSSNKHVMYAVDPKDFNPNDNNPAPKIVWEFSNAKGLWIAPPLEVGNLLFAPNSDGNVYVLDLTDGKSGKQAVEVIAVSQPGGDEARLWGQPVTDGERLFVTALDKTVTAIDLATYKVLWHADLGGAVPGGFALGGDGMLYVGSLAKQLERFDPATGEHTPVLDTNGWIWGTPVADGDNLYFADVDGYFYSYNTAEQKLNWEPVQPDSSITANPLVLGDKVLVATESGKVFAFDSTGNFDVWYTPDQEGKAYTTPVIAGDTVLVAYLESDYYLVALDQDGDKKWNFPE
ncbi:MAG: PQQ-binding-like beta-propeller repeat protein [Anaerolineales bacterium]|nr:PQQ-binding-like beta-propeller repeat protein [Anaerolineales bacterium]